jgi:hypothetical protein
MSDTIEIHEEITEVLEIVEQGPAGEPGPSVETAGDISATMPDDPAAYTAQEVLDTYAGTINAVLVALAGKQAAAEAATDVELAAAIADKVTAAGLVAALTPEPWHVVGAAGEPAYTNGVVALAGQPGARFYKDPFGVVHLEGLVDHPSGAAVAAFTLPAGYRPDSLRYFTQNRHDQFNAGRVEIRVDGIVQLAHNSTNYVSLDGITYRAA